MELDEIWLTIRRAFSHIRGRIEDKLGSIKER